MAERFISVPGQKDVTYTCPAGKSAVISGIAVQMETAGTCSIYINGSSAFVKTLTADSHNLTYYIGKLSITEYQSIGIHTPGGKVVITVLEIESSYTDSNIVVYNGFVFDKATGNIVDYNASAPGAVANNVTIPATIGGVAVTGLPGTFYGKSLTGSVPFLSGMTSIEESTYSYNNFGTPINIPGTVITLAEKAFYSSGITGTVTIPNSVTTQGQNVFSYSNITKLVVGSNCPEYRYPNPLAAYCPALTEVDLSLYPHSLLGVYSSFSSQMFYDSPIIKIKFPAGLNLYGGYDTSGNGALGLYSKGAYLGYEAASRAAGTYEGTGNTAWVKTA